MVSIFKRYQYHQIGTPPPSCQSRHYRLPLVLPYLSSSLRDALLPLQVTLTHFTLSSYERALRVSTSFPFSGLARLRVKPRLCRSSWRAFASTHPLMLPSTSPRDAFLACPCFPSCNPPSCTVKSTHFSLFSHSDLLFFSKVRLLLILTLFHLTIWCSGLMAMILFLLEKVARAYLPTAFSLFVVPRPLFPFQQAQYAQVSLLKPAPLCKLFAGLGSTNKPGTSLFLFI